MKTLLSILLTPVFYLLFGLTLLIFHPIQIICLNLFGYHAHKRSVVLLNWLLLHHECNGWLHSLPNALVVPIAIKNTIKFDNGGKLLKRVGVTVEFTMLEPRQLDIDSLPKQMEEIRSEISSAIN